LREVEGYVSKESFREGLRVYLKRHQYGCASSHHLWEALEEVSAKPVSKMMRSWIEQPGFPLVEVKREGHQLIITQERFTYLPNESAQVWLIPLAVKVFLGHGESKTITSLVDKKSAVIDIGPDAVAYKVNEGQSGFYRVKYIEEGNLQELGARVADKSLSAVDRWGLQNDLYAFVKKGDISLDDYLVFLSNYSDEDVFLPLISIATNLNHAYLVADETGKGSISTVGRSLFEKVLKSIGYEPKPEERHATSILRDQVIWHAVMYGSNEAAGFAQAKFSALLRGDKAHPDIMKSIMRAGAFYGAGETFEWFAERFKSSESEHERMNVLAAIGCFKEKTLIERTQQYVLDEVPDRNKFITIGIMAQNPHAIPLMWEWYLSCIERLEQLHPIHYERIVAAIVPMSGIGKEEEVKSFFREYMVKKEKAKDVLKLSLEKLEINSRMRMLCFDRRL
jgi:tricorn protease interacting factor F2/3